MAITLKAKVLAIEPDGARGKITIAINPADIYPSFATNVGSIQLVIPASAADMASLKMARDVVLTLSGSTGGERGEDAGRTRGGPYGGRTGAAHTGHTRVIHGSNRA